MCIFNKRRQKQSGQTALETAFVFSALLFLTFTIVNFAILFHTKNIATYAAFMAARSYQVIGDQTGAELFDEANGSFGKKTKLLGDLGKTVAAFRVAEDIFTCSLPWISVPQGDALIQVNPTEVQRNPTMRCLEGKRRYQNTNIGKSLKFSPFKRNPNPNETKLDDVPGSFTEKGRLPLRYGILNLKYRTPIIYNPMNVFGEKGALVQGQVNVPILLNPELEAGLQKAKPGEKDFDETKK
jgi:hypothetical protein